MITAHRIYISILVLITGLTLLSLIFSGFGYYSTSMEERFFHPDHVMLKPGGVWGHGLGIFGSLAIILGVVLYIVRKRNRSLSRYGKLSHWLEFHIFLCTIGPVLILFHTSFKFGGLVSVSFWSMVAVFLSGIIGRFIYIQIPRTIEGRELSLNEVRGMKTNIGEILTGSYSLDEESFRIIVESTRKKIGIYSSNFIVRSFRKYSEDRKTTGRVKSVMKQNNLTRRERKEVIKLVKHEISLNRRIDRLTTMQNLFKYWHVAHLPFAFVMLIIMVIHVVVTIIFGYRWIF